MELNALPYDVEVKKEIGETNRDSIDTQNADFVEPSSKESQALMQCVWCLLNLRSNDNPKLLECLHAACDQCLTQKLAESVLPNANVQPHTVSCALCNMPSMLGQIIDNRFITELTDEPPIPTEESDIKCSSCTEDALASNWCEECAEYICVNCVLAHQRLKITKEHTIKPKDSVNSSNHKSGANQNSPKLYCTMHPQEILSLFCETCDKLTCRDCQLTGHRDHKYKFSHEIADEARNFIHSLLEEVSYKRVLLASAMKVIDERQSLITDKRKCIVQEIAQMVIRLTNAINTRGKQLVMKLNEVCELKQKTLSEKKLALEQLSQQTDHCIDFVNGALDKCSDSAVLFSKRIVTNHLQRIKCRRADIPNPEIPVRIHLALEKVPDLIKVISSIATIVVDGKTYCSSAPSQQQVLPQQNLNSMQSQTNCNQNQSQQSGLLRPMGTPSPSSQQQYRVGMHNMPPQQQQYMPPAYSSIPNLNQQSHHQMNSSVIAPQHRQILPMGMIRRQSPSLLRHPTNIVRNQQVSSSTHPQNIVQQMQVQNPAALHCPDYNAIRTPSNSVSMYASRPTSFSGGSYSTPNLYTGKNYNRTINTNPIRTVSQSYIPPYQSQQPMHMPNQHLQQMSQLPSMNRPGPAPHKWHIPQNANSINGVVTNGQTGLLNGASGSYTNSDDNFRITIKQPSHKSGGTVTSTNPKTPSPNALLGSKDSESIDKFCQESVNDLMATIAKLDSIGVQVMPEVENEKGCSPQVHSSTDGTPMPMPNAVPSENKDDPNEDWCAVCMDGGELMCCDKCPKVFHQNCHIPALSSLPDESETWQCMLCFNFADIQIEENYENILSNKLKRVLQRLLLELYCQYEPSLPFRELVSPENLDYYSKIKQPIALSTIKQKLEDGHPGAYNSVSAFIKDVKLMFSNAYLYNDVEDIVYKNAVTLEEFFDVQVQKYFPSLNVKLENNNTENEFPPMKRMRRQLSD
ncbi:E3 ubiquitin-protein ligase TRIM33-like isoform X2 [Ctenocephalides felis]|uniref:E3 ubiquitin-protein ligase TRIM33-like isoform X2 n=1 Tax=Ctenocephalides felis TaxID=7515 RepID=UPI000E6E1EAE|nr:E3 ubiquitin-protein ligase TRIM33-like isoform X2 [Ctenocephalides felis]